MVKTKKRNRDADEEIMKDKGDKKKKSKKAAGICSRQGNHWILRHFCMDQ